MKAFEKAPSSSSSAKTYGSSELDPDLDSVAGSPKSYLWKTYMLRRSGAAPGSAYLDRAACNASTHSAKILFDSRVGVAHNRVGVSDVVRSVAPLRCRIAM